MGGLSHQFYKEIWNYAKLILGVLCHGMSIVHTVDLITSLRLDDDNINNYLDSRFNITRPPHQEQVHPYPYRSASAFARPLPQTGTCQVP